MDLAELFAGEPFRHRLQRPPVPRRSASSPASAHPELGALPTSAGPEPEDVLLAIETDVDRRVDGPVGDLAIADFGSVADLVAWRLGFMVSVA